MASSEKGGRKEEREDSRAKMGVLHPSFARTEEYPERIIDLVHGQEWREKERGN